MTKYSSTYDWLRVATASRLLQLLLVAASVTAINASQLQLKDTISGPCRASFTNGSLDLSPLDSLSKTGKPRFPNFGRVSINGIETNVSYNLCSGFKCKSDKAAAICAQNIFYHDLLYDIASQSRGNISEVNGILQIRYGTLDQSSNVSTLVTLVCSPSSDVDRLTDVQMSQVNVLTFKLVSKLCCLVSPKLPAVTSSWSVGDYMVLAFFLTVLLYFVSFLAINGLIRKRSGLDLLPHRHAWIYASLLIKDGCVFTFSTIRQKVIVCRRGSYTEI